MESTVLFIASEMCVSIIFCPTKSPLKARHSEEQLGVKSHCLKFHQE